MAPSRAARLRRLWLNVHLWLGVGLALLLIPVAVSGALLVWHDHLDYVVNPARYAVTGDALLAPSAYLDKAKAAVPAELRPSGVRYPEEAGWPVRVVTRAATQAPGERPRFVTVFLDPPTANVLDVMEFGSSLIGFLHVFHENLMLPQYNGRQIVGWVGVAMLILSLTGIWLWWPRNGALLKALRWRRSPQTITNLHHLFGFWIAIPLAVVSLTGIYLSFPQTARSFMSSVAPMTPQVRRGFGGQAMERPSLTADRALEIALATAPGAKPSIVFLPSEPERQGPRAQANDRERGAEAKERRNAETPRAPQGRAAGPAPSWRVQLSHPDSDHPITVMVSDATGAAERAPDRLTGDRAAAWMRWIHEGSHSGPVWQVLVFLTGVLPVLFAVTGIIMWLRRRSNRKALEARIARPAPQMNPAE